MGLDGFLSTYAMVACARARAFNCTVLDPKQSQSWKAGKSSTEDLSVGNYVSKLRGLRARIPKQEVSSCRQGFIMKQGTNADSDPQSRF